MDVVIFKMEDDLWHVYDSDSLVVVELDFDSYEDAVKWCNWNGYKPLN